MEGRDNRLIESPNHHNLVLKQGLPLRRGNTISILQVEVLNNLTGSDNGVLSSNDPEAAIYNVFYKPQFRRVNLLSILLISNDGKDNNWDLHRNEGHGLDVAPLPQVEMDEPRRVGTPA